MGSKVAAVHGRTDEYGRGLVFAGERSVKPGIGLSIIALISAAADEYGLIDAALAELFKLLRGKLARNDGHKRVAGLIAQPSNLAAQLKRHGMYSASVMLNVYPHVFEVFFVHHLLLTP